MSKIRWFQIEAERLAIARQIRAAGVPVHIREDDDPTVKTARDLLVYQFGGVTESLVFDFYAGTGVALATTITIDRWGFAIADFGLELPWGDHITWLPDPRNSGLEEYRFSPQHELVLPRAEALNHRANVRHLFRRGESLSGTLLGTVNETIPEDIKHGAEVSAFLTIYDQLWQPHRAPVSFWADRSARFASRRAHKTPRRSIFDYPDVPRGPGCNLKVRAKEARRAGTAGLPK